MDVGTTMIKAVGYADDGAEAVVVRRPATVRHPVAGWAEQDMAEVWDAVAGGVREVVRKLDAPVAHVAVTAQGDGCWLVGPDGEPTGPAILWNDARAVGVVDEWAQQGVLERAFAVNGSLTFAGLPNAILAWLRRHDPERVERSATALTCGGWIFQRMTGELAADESDASAPFLDIRSRAYAPQLLRMYDLDWAERLLPEIRRDQGRVAGLSAAAAERTGLAPGTPVVMGPYDIVATAIGAGAVAAGQACSILGTTLCTEVMTTGPELDGEAAGLTIALSDRYLRAFPSLAGGEVVQWACEMLALDEPAEFIDLALRGTPGAAGLVFLPYLSPAGERAPFLDPLARGTLLGLSSGHGREQVARAVLEGLTLVVADCLAASRTRPSELRVCGGGAASSGWLQLIADITGVPVLRSADTEAGARGAFLVAAVATGAEPTLEAAAARHVGNRDTFRPDPAATGFYAELLADFVSLRATVSAAGPRLASRRSRLTPAPGGRA
ncbi:carbohydrate kinase [Actinoplanes bogorensis]|uniref:Carbohydrate kinase n=1 Tax=Paractinoplanes bogorensis TaxID=1610840 RepID=A0ABS5YV76_9ACTN|nr:FGGY-family carbohydrate kinase [Actinoplanes bogorensis]MBU2667349.1 carbohydrate kinase [Actinoplanes bogorensis]